MKQANQLPWFSWHQSQTSHLVICPPASQLTRLYIPITLPEIIVESQSPCSHAFYKLPDMTHSMFSKRHCWLSLFFIFRLSKTFIENGYDPGCSFFSHDILHLNPSNQLQHLSAAKFQNTSWRPVNFYHLYT